MATGSGIPSSAPHTAIKSRREPKGVLPANAFTGL